MASFLYLKYVCRSKSWDEMDSEARYHWRCLGWGRDTWNSGPNPPSTRPVLARSSLWTDRRVSGDSKTWLQLNAVERQSAQWLGYNEQRWEVRRRSSCRLSLSSCRLRLPN